MFTDTRPDYDGEGSLVDVLWQSSYEQTGPEVQRVRRKMIAQMGRYGHQSMFGLDDVCISEFLDRYRALVDLMSEESATAGVMET